MTENEELKPCPLCEGEIRLYIGITGKFCVSRKNRCGFVKTMGVEELVKALKKRNVKTGEK